MHPRWITTAVAAVLVASCSSAYDTTDFLGRGPTAAATATPAATQTAGASADAAKPANAEDAPAPAKAADAKPDEPAETPPAPAAAEAQPAQARSLLAMFRAAATPAPAAAAAEAAATAEALPPNAEKTAADSKTTAPATTAVASLAPEEEGGDEVSEADLAGEVEADPTKIAVPEEPIDDGLEHDFVNVYSSKPDAPAETVPGLPGVTWDGNLVVASRGDNGDPGSLFDDEDHPFARTVPGVPRQVVQAANGLLLAHSAINVSCIKPDLLGLVRRAESHFGHKVVVTSGYRSPSHNRRVHGARFSQHLYCNALDLFMPGIARDDLARYFFAQPDRGGIGLYCHTRSIHVDMGRKRQWRWSCRKRG